MRKPDRQTEIWAQRHRDQGHHPHPAPTKVGVTPMLRATVWGPERQRQAPQGRLPKEPATVLWEGRSLPPCVAVDERKALRGMEGEPGRTNGRSERAQFNVECDHTLQGDLPRWLYTYEAEYLPSNELHWTPICRRLSTESGYRRSAHSRVPYLKSSGKNGLRILVLHYRHGRTITCDPGYAFQYPDSHRSGQRIVPVTHGCDVSFTLGQLATADNCEQSPVNFQVGDTVTMTIEINRTTTLRIDAPSTPIWPALPFLPRLPTTLRPTGVAAWVLSCRAGHRRGDFDDEVFCQRLFALLA